MYLKSNIKIPIHTELTEAHCKNALLIEGLTITDEENLLFTERYDFSTHKGNNQRRGIYTLLQGQLKIDNEKSIIFWKLKIHGLIFKTVLLFTFSFSLLKFLAEIPTLFSFVLSGFFALLLCIVNLVQLENRVNSITKKITSTKVAF